MKTILLVDDDPNLRLLVHTTLANPDYRILEAGSAKEARDHTKQERLDLVVLDWMLPDTTGLDIAKEMRADPLTASTPIIMLTARGQYSDRARATEVGLTAYLVKPFSPLELTAQVESVLH